VPHSGHHRQQDCRRPDDGTKRVADRTWRWPRRSRGHRVLRLFAAVGIIAGGLSLVLASTELMAELGQRKPGSPAPTVGRTVASYGGKRTEHPKEIPIPGPGLYRIAWSFRCAPGRSGEFVLEDRSASGSSNTEVTAAGQHRQGIWSGHVRAGRSLYIASGCAWQAHIVVPAHASTANPPPGHSGAHKHHANKKKHVGKKHSSTGRPHKKKGTRSARIRTRRWRSRPASRRGRAPAGHAFSASLPAMQRLSPRCKHWFQSSGNPASPPRAAIFSNAELLPGRTPTIIEPHFIPLHNPRDCVVNFGHYL
jgi:hypothetical protein